VVSRQAKLFQGTDGHILRDFCIKYCELWQNKPKNERHFEIPRRERLSEADNNNMSFASQNLISNASSNLDLDPKPEPVSENDSVQRIVTPVKTQCCRSCLGFIMGKI
jgi:hypothetical protein